MKTIVPPLDYDYALKRILDFIREKVEEAEVNGVVVGLSGGVDSSVTVALAVKALGKDRVYGLILPDERTTPDEDIEDAVSLANKLGIRFYKINIGSIYDAIISSLPFYDGGNNVANGNIRARIRMIILYYIANTEKLMVCGTGDKSEILLGYFTKYGDGGVDILPIGDLYKTQVRELGRRLKLPKKLYMKPSSPRLWPGQTAEDEIGLTYEVIDTILFYYFDLRKDIENIVSETGIPEEYIRKIINRVHKNEHKRMTPLIPKIRGISINNDWKMPYSPSID